MSNLVDYLEEVSMRRRFFTAFAGVVSFLMIGVMTADAAEITFGGRLRPRYEYWNSGPDSSFINVLTRLQAKAKIDDSTSAFIQLQSNNRWGSQLGQGMRNGGVLNSSASNPGSPNDTTADVGIHQAYFTLNKLFGAPVDLQLGRQEVILDGHRLFGNTVWTQGMQSHDALRLTHSHDNMTLLYVYSKAAENAGRGDVGNFAGGSPQDNDDIDVHVLWGNFKGLVGDNSSTSVYTVLSDTDCNAVNACAGSADYWTIGARQAGGFGNFSYRGEFYYQTGKSGGAAPTGGSGDVDAYLFGARAGYKAANVAMKPSLTLFYDHLSGTNSSDVAAGDIGAFNVLFDTGHKFYGLMDFYLTPAQFARGLHDVAIKLSVQPMAKTTLKVDLHHFAETSYNGVARTGVSNGARTLGQEIDMTLVHKYSPSTKMVVGYSHYFMRDSQGGANTEDADWLYVMFDVTF
jgi:Alginate export